jgi:hypothetical protein
VVRDPGRAYSGQMSDLSTESALLGAFARGLGLRPHASATFTGQGTLESAFAVSELAAASIAAAGLATSELLAAMTDEPVPVSVDRALACGWFATALTPVGWELPSPWDALAGDYRTSDGWIRLHTNAPRHRAAALAVLGVAPDKEAVAGAVGGWRGDELESAVVDAGGCAAVMRSADDWARHPQGARVAREPLVHWSASDAAEAPMEAGDPARPLAGIRVLDLTRVIAGPVATRLLAGLGADVLRVDPPGWDEPALVPDMTLGKRTTRIDATTTVGRDALEHLVAGADVLVHGYRPGALDALVPADRRSTLRPGLIEVSLDAYGFTGPWRGRRGFDSLVQMSSGIAEAGMRWAGASKPVPLPLQALDHASGYLAAAAALVAIARVRRGGAAGSARVSLARTAALLLEHAGGAAVPGGKLPTTRIDTEWGPAELLAPPLTIEGTRLAWPRGPRALGSDEPRW